MHETVGERQRRDQNHNLFTDGEWISSCLLQPLLGPGFPPASRTTSGPPAPRDPGHPSQANGQGYCFPVCRFQSVAKLSLYAKDSHVYTRHQHSHGDCCRQDAAFNCTSVGRSRDFSTDSQALSLLAGW